MLCFAEIGNCDSIIAAELGDFEDIELDEGFTKDIDLMPKLASSMEDKIVELYKELRRVNLYGGQTNYECILPHWPHKTINQTPARHVLITVMRRDHVLFAFYGAEL